MAVTRPSSALRAVIDPWYSAPLIPVLARRRQALVDSLGVGSVLVLTGPPAVVPAGAPAVVDHVVTVGWLAATDDLDAGVAQLLERLAPNGWLHAIEPSRGPAGNGRAQDLAAPVGRIRTGWHLGRNIPVALRRGGLVITDKERFSMPVSSTVLQPWVQLRARRPVSTAPGAGS